MATAKEKFTRTKQTAERLDWLMSNARILRSPALWEKYYEALRIVRLLGCEVTVEGGRYHRVTPC